MTGKEAEEGDMQHRPPAKVAYTVSIQLPRCSTVIPLKLPLLKLYCRVVSFSLMIIAGSATTSIHKGFVSVRCHWLRLFFSFLWKGHIQNKLFNTSTFSHIDLCREVTKFSDSPPTSAVRKGISDAVIWADHHFWTDRNISSICLGTWWKSGTCWNKLKRIFYFACSNLNS